MSTKPTASMTIPTRIVTEVIFWFAPFCHACGRMPVLEYAQCDDGRFKLIKVSSEPDDPSTGTHLRLMLLAVFLAGLSIGLWISALG
ncbi:hypothetical protein [Methylobacterium sp.]|uniref:hypothetical protein n=1 Tax=Methylobacterium sp. TaxID=409 RepID=UPI000C64E780|nr:hypothetical protein [Methylobacterium sp.]MBP30434.1 hypothetical protein [Methylobacterium sp.]